MRPSIIHYFREITSPVWIKVYEKIRLIEFMQQINIKKKWRLKIHLSHNFTLYHEKKVSFFIFDFIE